MGMAEFWFELAQHTVAWFNDAAHAVNVRDGYYHIRLLELKFDRHDYTYIVYGVSFDGTITRRRSFDYEKHTELISYLDGLCDAIMMV